MEMNVFFEQTWFKRLLNTTPVIISAIAVIILGVLLAKLVWLWLTPQAVASNFSVTNTDQAIQKTAVQRIEYGQQIADFHLFGVAEKKAVGKQTTIKKVVPITRLNLKLHGTFAYTNRKGFAVISAAGKKQKTYEKGDKIGGGNNITLDAIYPNYVMLDRNGKKERLALPEKKTLTSQHRPAPMISVPRLPTPSFPQKPPTTNVPTESVLDTNNLEGLRQNLLKNPTKLMDIARAEEVKEGDKFMGFRLNPGKDKRTFDAMGFKAGDVVTSVNGTTIENPAQGFSIMQTLTTADSISVTVKRGKETITLDGVF